MKTFTELFTESLQSKRYEPVERIKCLSHVPRGKRNIPERPRTVMHTYPIKGGISLAQKALENVKKINELMRRIKEVK
ncbi:hypothetical protein [Methylobacter sp.]|uniref:hypothetical protein n=1 Tax=Methylobacter sp. TaxID=2051955 RepID=UPI0025CD4082|nr:hypothetical protein [Methylobacter sp.]